MVSNLKKGIILALIASVIAISSIGIAYAENSDEQYETMIYNIDMSKDHLDVSVYEYNNGRIEDAKPPVEDVDLFYTKLQKEVVSRDKELDNRIRLNLIKLLNLIDSEAPAKEIEEKVNELKSDLDEVKKLLVPAEKLQDLNINIKIIMGYLDPHGSGEYAEGVNRFKEVIEQAEYDEALKMFKSAHERYLLIIEDKVATKHPNQNLEIKEEFETLINKAETKENPSEITELTKSINKKLMEVIETETKTGTATTDDTMEIVRYIKDILASSLKEYQNGNLEAAYEKAVSAYLDGYEGLEGAVASKDHALNSKLESNFAKLRTQIKSNSDEEEINATISEINRDLDKVTKLLSTDTASGFLAFFNSLVIILREGIEAALVIGAVIGYLIATRNEKYLKHVYLGIGIALIATLVTWIIAQTIISISGASREMLEGITALIAVVVLFYVSYWLISKIEVKKWTEYIKSKVQLAMTTGNILILASIAFFAVYREGFETVLFYQALWLNSIGQESSVLFGFIVGTAILLGVVFGIFKLGLKIPLRTFFGITSAILYYLAFTFAGQGIHELQEAGVISETPLNIPEIGLIGMYPTLETLAAQMLLVLALLIGLVYVFRIRPVREGLKEAEV